VFSSGRRARRLERHLAAPVALALALALALLAGVVPPSMARAQTTAKRDVVLLIDNHIVYVNKPFVFDEAVLRASIRATLERVRPERVVVFAVGHDGHAQYPSKFFPQQKPSKAYPLLKPPGQDLMKIWREETTRTNTKMIVYVSTLRNDALAELRPDYLRVFGNGVQATVIDHNSPFIDEVLLPGLQEIIDKYQPDGFFLDADYWTLHESWNPATTKRFEVKTGLPVPRDYPDASYPPFVQFTYDSYRDDYVSKLETFFARQKKPLNWSINAAFTVRDPSPEPANYGTVSVDLPFFALGEAYIESLFSQRLKGGAEVVYPLFAQSEGAIPFQYKGKAQLKQELAVAVANRSLMSFYLPLGLDSTIALDRIQPAIDVYDDFERNLGFSAPGDGQKLLAKLAVVDTNGDAVATRQFGELRKVSLQLFGAGVVHALTTESLVTQGGYSHVVFPHMDRSERPQIVADMAAAGVKVLWAVDERLADDKTKRLLSDLRRDPRFEETKSPRCPAGCEVLRTRTGGEVWIVRQIDDTTLAGFTSDLRDPVTFPGKPDYVYALPYGDERKMTIYLSSVAWGGSAMGRHTLFDHLDLAPPVTIRFDRAWTCVQRSLSGETKFPAGREIVARPFDTLTKIECAQ
jgi:hypothetical protein